MIYITINDLHFSYPVGEEVIRGITLSFGEEPTAIIGQNGAGKTTFVKLLKGLLQPSGGEITVCGHNTKNTTAAELAKHIGLVFQNPNDQIFKNKVLDEIMYGPRNIGQTEMEARENALLALEWVGLAEKADANPYDLSLSERKMVTIASIIAMNTKIVIFDEPTIAQDYGGKQKIKSIIRRLQEKGTLVLTIIHDMDFVAEAFERVIVFQQGKVLLDGHKKEVYAKAALLKQAYLEQPHVTQLCNELGWNDIYLTVEEFLSNPSIVP
ncbi:abc transporter [Lucifera butyrica]|uniref:Abc transporter n=1 Tax=Lucifera butyrica TaxID=1351585 RepID=A0A498R2C7_9FIRM|nr:ABC transporter ATP-binding protein [Lucifera butyrica]VBB04920.1 abc transporter [Lucifera butyrica]